MTKKFRVKADLPTEKSKDAKAEVFGNNADKQSTKSEKADKSFTVPLNDYELEMLRQYADQEERSMRFVSRRLLREILESKLN
jgi:hypothetical protein